MPSPSVRDRFSYAFDSWMSRGTIALVGLLGLATMLFVGLFAFVVWLLPIHEDAEPEGDFLEVFWVSLMRALDPGNIAGDGGWLYRAVMMIVTIGGLIIVASLIGIVSGGFDAKVADLRKGRSRVLENGHTLILGWSDKVFTIISELAIANESQGRSSIVVLADRDKVEMEEAIRQAVGPTRRTRVIVRSGDPMSMKDLAIGNPASARSIILLATEGSDDPDAEVIKTALAIVGVAGRREAQHHIVAELQSPHNLEAARLVGRNEVQWVTGADLVSRIVVQTCRQSGLSVVYSELLDFDGDEIYIDMADELIGRTYGEAQFVFESCAVMGTVSDGRVHINPPAATVLSAGDQLIILAEDDSTVRVAGSGVPDVDALVEATVQVPSPERTLVLGHNGGLELMLTELDAYVCAGSSVLIVAERDEPELPELDAVDTVFRRGDVTSRRVLEQLDVASADHIIVLADMSIPAQRADAKTLITLLHLRDIAEQKGVTLNVVSEMLDDKNRELAEVTDADDFIVSDKLIALMLSQLSENRLLAGVFDALFSAEGSEIYLRPATSYVRAGVEVDFYTVLEAAQRRGETALGYRVGDDRQGGIPAHGVVLNPVKTQRRSFSEADRIIVLAEQ